MSIGIDLGSQTACIGYAKKGVEILTNEGSQRETNVVIGFKDNERQIGEQGFMGLKSNFKNSVVYPTRFLGMRGDSPNFKEEKKWLYNPCIVNEDNSLSFQVRYKGEQARFSPEQVTAMFLQKLVQTYRKHGVSLNEFVLSVPSYFTQQERRALLDAAKIADVKVLQLMNESTAIALSYGIFRKKELTDKPRNVIFIDVGHSKTSAFVASFTSEKLTMLNQVHERNLGTRDLDWNVLEHYCQLFEKQSGENVIGSAKPRLRLLEAIEKQRKVLSANQEAGVNLEFLFEDFDLNQNLTREEFENLNAKVWDRFRVVMENLKSEIKCDIHSLEIVGGGCRIPMIQKVIGDVFGLECMRTLNSTECIARGCAMRAAVYSPLLKVVEYKIEDANYYPIRCNWLFTDGNDQALGVESDGKNNVEKQTSILFPKGCIFPAVKAITFHRDDPMIAFKLKYDPIPQGADEGIAEYKILTQKPKEPEYGVKIRVHLTESGVIEFDSAQLLEDYYEEITVPKESSDKKEGDAPKEGEKKEGDMKAEGAEDNKKEPETEIKKKKKTRSTQLKAEISRYHQLLDSIVAKHQQEEQKMLNQDRITIETAEKKNEVESFIYDTRAKLDDIYASYVDATDKQAFLQLLQASEDWLYGDGAKASKDVYQNKFEELATFGSPIFRRYNEYQNLPDVVAAFMQTLENYQAVVASNDDKYAHITSEERKPVLESIANNKKWLSTISQQVADAKRDQEPPVKCQEIVETHKNFINEYRRVIEKEKPKPKAEPKKEEETAKNGEKKEGDMKDEKAEKKEGKMDSE